MIKVKALNTYAKHNIVDNKLGRQPKEGEVFEVTEERAKVLLGDNIYGLKLVELLEETKTEEPVVTEETQPVEEVEEKDYVLVDTKPKKKSSNNKRK